MLVEDWRSARRAGASRLPKLVFSSNGQGIALSGRSNRFMKLMSAADVIHADGMPVVVASKLTKAPLPERIATTDFFHDAAQVAATHGIRFYMLGANEEQNKRAVQAAQNAYPDLKIVGRHHGYFNETEEEAICDQIKKSKADVVWVALGKPGQEEWCWRNREKLHGVSWLKTCGGLYEFLAGDAPRAPRWMQTLGLEWLYRMLNDPSRLTWRYLSTNPYAAYRLLTRTKRDPVV